jgi:hypothetical protein
MKEITDLWLLGQMRPLEEVLEVFKGKCTLDFFPKITDEDLQKYKFELPVNNNPNAFKID